MSRIENLCDEKNKNNIANSMFLVQPSYQGCLYFPQEFRKNGTKMATVPRKFVFLHTAVFQRKNLRIYSAPIKRKEYVNA